MATELQTEYSAPQLRQRLEPHLRGRSGPATLGDIAAETGLPSEQTEPILRQLLDEYDGRVQVDENGELVYAFPRGLKPKANTFGDVMQAVKETLWAWFKVAYKVGILVILVLYFVLFFVIMIAAMVAMVAAASSSDSDLDLDGCTDGCGDGCGGAGCSPFDLIWFMDPPGTYRSSPAKFQRGGTTPYKTKPKSTTKGPPFWIQAFEFVFGEEKPKPDPLQRERELVAYIRDHRGRITVADVVALTGQSADEAEGILNHLMVAHAGDIEVSDEGVLIYTFDRLMVSAGRSAGQPAANRRWSWWWERTESPEKLNRNSSAANWGFGLLNAFNLIWSSIFTFAGPGEIGVPLAVYILIGPIPWVYSLLFFGIPLVRHYKLQTENRLRAWRNMLREAARKVFKNHIAAGPERTVSPGRMVQYQREPGDQIHTAGLMEQLLDSLTTTWRGERRSGPDGAIYAFDELREAWTAAAKARAKVDPEQWRIGQLAYDTEDQSVEDEFDFQERMRGEEPGDG